MNAPTGQGVRASLSRTNGAQTKRNLVLRLSFGAEVLAATGWQLGNVIAVDRYPGNSLFFRARMVAFDGHALRRGSAAGQLTAYVPRFDGLPVVPRKIGDCFWTMDEAKRDEVSFVLPAWGKPARLKIPRDYFKDDPRATRRLGAVPVSRASGLVTYAR